VLACVEPCRGHPFSLLGEAVAAHLGELSGCICILLDWDEARQELVRRLHQGGVPCLTLVVSERLDKAALAPGPLADHPERLRLLHPATLERDLRGL